LKIVFMGTPDFSVPCLEGLIEAGHEISLVVTQADKPKGRGHHLMPPPVKECAIKHQIPVFQPTRMKDDETYEILQKTEADVFIVVAYGKILPKRILDLPRYGCINVHASLLPKYRGAAPIQWSILGGETVTGVTTMQMDEGLDTGDMLLKKEIAIKADDTGSSLHDKLSILGREVLLETMHALENGTLSPQKQPDEGTCYASMITKETAKIDFAQPSVQIALLVRAMNSYPYAYTTYEGKLLKIIRAKAHDAIENGALPGAITAVTKEALYIACGSGQLEVFEIQMEGKKKMTVAEYVKGNSFTIGTVLQ